MGQKIIYDAYQDIEIKEKKLNIFQEKMLNIYKEVQKKKKLETIRVLNNNQDDDEEGIY